MSGGPGYAGAVADTLVFIPAWNEAASLPALLDEARRDLPDVDLLVIDDGSTDETAAVARAGGAQVVSFPENHGLRYGIAEGYRQASARGYDFCGRLDADGQHPPASIPGFLAAAGDGAELVIGDRFGDLGSMPLQRRLMNRAASRILSLTTGRDVRDSQSGMRLLRGRALGTTPFPEGRYEAETRHLKAALLGGLAVVWVPIPAIYEGERSSFRAAGDTVRVLTALLARPTTASPTAAPSVAPASTSIT